jgi:hypothetical protein
MRVRSQWTFVAGLGIALAMIALALAVAVQKPLRIAWHRELMQRAWRESQSGGDATESYLRFESHLQTLTDLGALTKQEYRFANLKVPTPESTHFIKRLLSHDCPPLLNFTAEYQKSPEPMVITLWHEHEFRDEWHEFLKAADIPNYREKFMAAIHPTPPE